MRRWPSPWQASQRPPETLKENRPGFVAALARFRQHGIEIANRSEDAGIGCRIRARRAADGRLIDANDFVDVLRARNRLVLAGFFARTVKLPGQRAIENVIDQRGFARTRDAGHHRHDAERKSHVEILEIVFFRAENGERRAVRLAALGTHLNLHSAGDVSAGERVRLAHDFLGRAMRDQISAMASGAGAEVDHVIRAANGFFVVLDHQHGVAQIAQIFQRGQQPAIVAMMQADGRLVQHIEHAAQLRANLRRQPNALAFAAGESRRRAVERNVVQSNGIQKLQPLDNFMHDASGDVFFAPRELDSLRHFQRPRNRQRREIGNRHAVYFHRQALRPQPLAVACRTFARRHVIHQPIAIAFRGRLLQILFQISEDSAEAGLAAA